MVFVLYCHLACDTGKRLAREMEAEGGELPPDSRQDILIRFGNSSRVPYQPSLAINKRAAVLRTCQKDRAMRILRLHHLPVPREKTSVPCVARASSHYQGTGFWVCRSPQELRRAKEGGASHFLEIVPLGREYRVHVLGKGTLIDEKFLIEGGDASNVCRSYEMGWRTRRSIESPETDTLRDLATKAVHALGLDFGAVDIGIRSDTEKPVIFEVNTAPSLRPSLRRIYEIYLTEVIRKYEEIQNPSSSR